MTLAAAMALLLATAAPAPLDEARRAFAAGDYAAAERLAIDAASSEADAPAARYLAGLARFRSGRPAEALEALDGAEAGADSPAAWRFNRGACLYELGRHAEAEAAFLEAAADPAWAALALVNAGFAALDGGAPGRAAALAARARAAAGAGPALPIVEELEQALQPDATAPAAAAWTFSLRAGAGWDDDALRAASGTVERPGQVTAQVESAFLAGGVTAEVAVPSGQGTALVAGYGLAEHAYLAAEAEDYSVQQHDLVLALRGRAGPHLLEAALLGQYALAGLSDLRGLQGAAGVRLAGAREWAGGQVTRAEATFTWKDGIGQEFASLDGTRLDLAASHEVRLDPVLLRGGYRLQLERIGEVRTALPDLPAGSPACPLGCAATGVEPLSYRGQTGWLSARLDPWPWLRLDVSAAVEGREGIDDLYTLLQPPGGAAAVTAALQHRSDLRGFGGEAVGLRAAPWLTVTLRHDWLANRTTLSAATPRFLRAGGTSTWDKQVLTLELLAEW